MPSPCNITVISPDCLSARSIYHPWPYFHCRLTQNDLKSETNITCTKFKNTENSRVEILLGKKKIQNLLPKTGNLASLIELHWESIW